MNTKLTKPLVRGSVLMACLTLCLTVLSACSSLPGRGAAGRNLTLDFEDIEAMTFMTGNPIPARARLSDAYLDTHGVRFSSGSPYVAVVDLGVGHATSGTNGIGGSTPDGRLTYDARFPMVARFFDPSDPSVPAVTSFVSVRQDLLGSRQVTTLKAYDLDGKMIACSSERDDGGRTLSLSAPGIHSVEFLASERPAEWRWTISRSPLPPPRAGHRGRQTRYREHSR